MQAEETRVDRLDEAVALEIRAALVRYWTMRGLSELAEDLAQEGLAKVCEKVGKWEGRSSLKTFSITVGKNAGRDYLKSTVYKHDNLRAGIGVAADIVGIRDRLKGEE